MTPWTDEDCTDWITDGSLPERPGVYQRKWRNSGEPSFAYWDVKGWGPSYSIANEDYEEAFMLASNPDYCRNGGGIKTPLPWRGLKYENGVQP